MERFTLRRAVERLRDGLFDQVAVEHLTIIEERIKNVFTNSLNALGNGQSDHLCVCGSYGQGKSHTLTYLNQLALSLGFATSTVQLDLREIPFHQSAVVYRAIMEHLVLPDGKKFVNAWKHLAHQDAARLLDPMPHRFKMILTAMLGHTRRLSAQERALKTHHDYKPQEYDFWLEQALMGYNIPITRLKNLFKYREITGYKEQSLHCRDNDSYIQMLQTLGNLLKKMEYKGLILFFDEAESIAQGRLNNRAKCYHILDHLFQGNNSVLPVFAFTDDFFDKVKHENYNDSKAIFPKNYADLWVDLNILHLQEFSAQGWELLLDRLMQLYSKAYQIDVPPHVKGSLQVLLDRVAANETRFKLKALVNKLDIETQQVWLDA